MSQDRYESGCDSPSSLVQSSDELAEQKLTLRNRNNNRILAALIAHLQNATDPIHRARIPYSKFHLQKRVAILTKVALR